MVKLQFLASQMVLEGPPRWPGVAIETPSLHFVYKMDKAGGSMATPSLARGGHRTPTQANGCIKSEEKKKQPTRCMFYTKKVVH